MSNKRKKVYLEEQRGVDRDKMERIKRDIEDQQRRERAQRDVDNKKQEEIAKAIREQEERERKQREKEDKK